jgi:hypothetical protein
MLIAGVIRGRRYFALPDLFYPGAIIMKLIAKSMS